MRYHKEREREINNNNANSEKRLNNVKFEKSLEEIFSGAIIVA